MQGRASEFSKLLFGNKASQFFQHDDGQPTDVVPAEFVYTALRLLGNLRNRGFHFKGRNTFVRGLQDSWSDNQIGATIRWSKETDDWTHTLAAIKALHTTDIGDVEKRMQNVLRGAQFEHYASTNELGLILELLRSDKVPDVTLPKFNLVLKRVENTGEFVVGGGNGSLPPAASESKLKDPAARAKFVAMKELYEGPFRSWMEKLEREPLQDFINRAIERGTREAKSINDKAEYKDLIRAKPENLILPMGDESPFADYMKALQAEQASEMRLQNGYDSDPIAAKKQMEWIENFRRDVVLRAFVSFLESNKQKIRWLLDLKTEMVPTKLAFTLAIWRH